MKGVGLYRYLPIDHAESLVDVELPMPVYGDGDLLVRVKAVSVNPVDTKVRMPKEQIETEPRILGWDAAGVVEATGAHVTQFAPGDEVYYAGDITRPGTNSEYHVVDERIVAKKPSTMDFASAAAVPLVAITAYEALFDRMRIRVHGSDAGKTLLIIGGAGGVGSMAIQLAQLAGLNVVATASRPESEAWIKSLGPVQVIDHRKALRPQIAALGVTEVHYIANFVDTDAYWDCMADLIAPQGTICTIVDHKGPLPQALLKMKSVAHVWEFMFTRSRYGTADLIEQQRLLARIAEWIDAGKVKSILRERLSPINATTLRHAHARLESGAMIGKLVVSGWGAECESGGGSTGASSGDRTGTRGR